MKLRDLARELGLQNLTPALDARQDVEVHAGHSSDLLSDVLANAPSGGLLVTLQIHLNTIAVALHAHLVAVVVPAGLEPEPEVVERAEEEGILLYVTGESTFDVVGRLWALGLRGGRG